MQKDKILKWALPLLVMIAMGVWFNASNVPGKNYTVKKSREIKEAETLKNELTAMTKKFKKLNEQKFSEDSYGEWGRNPFYLDKEYQPIEAGEIPEQENREPVLNGIFWDDENPSAVINNRYVAVNDTLGEYTVMAIQKNVVVLSDGMDHIELRTGLY